VCGRLTRFQRERGKPAVLLFLIGGALIGAGAGAVYEGTTGLVLEATEPETASR